LGNSDAKEHLWEQETNVMSSQCFKHLYCFVFKLTILLRIYSLIVIGATLFIDILLNAKLQCCLSVANKANKMCDSEQTLDRTNSVSCPINRSNP